MYTSFTYSEFLDFLTFQMKRKFKEIKKDIVCECLFDVDTKYSNLKIRIYSTISIYSKSSRPIGTDAIRLVLWDSVSQLPFGSETSTKRTVGWDKRLIEKIKDLETSIKGICPKCGGYLIYRKGKFGKFIGCSNYSNKTFSCRYSI